MPARSRCADVHIAPVGANVGWHPLRGDKGCGIDRFGVDPSFLDIHPLAPVAHGVFQFHIQRQPAKAFRVAAVLPERIGAEGAFQVGLQQVNNLGPCQIDHQHRRVGRHDVPQIDQCARAGRGRRAIAPTVGKGDPGSGGAGNYRQQQIIHRRVQRGRAAQRDIGMPHNLRLKRAGGCHGGIYQVLHRWIRHDAVIDRDQAMPMAGYPAALHIEFKAAHERAVAPQLDHQRAIRKCRRI